MAKNNKCAAITSIKNKLGAKNNMAHATVKQAENAPKEYIFFLYSIVCVCVVVFDVGNTRNYQKFSAVETIIIKTQQNSIEPNGEPNERGKPAIARHPDLLFMAPIVVAA